MRRPRRALRRSQTRRQNYRPTARTSYRWWRNRRCRCFGRPPRPCCSQKHHRCSRDFRQRCRSTRSSVCSNPNSDLPNLPHRLIRLPTGCLHRCRGRRRLQDRRSRWLGPPYPRRHRRCCLACSARNSNHNTHRANLTLSRTRPTPPKSCSFADRREQHPCTRLSFAIRPSWSQLLRQTQQNLSLHLAVHCCCPCHHLRAA